MGIESLSAICSLQHDHVSLDMFLALQLQLHHQKCRVKSAVVPSSTVLLANEHKYEDDSKHAGVEVSIAVFRSQYVDERIIDPLCLAHE